MDGEMDRTGGLAEPGEHVGDFAAKALMALRCRLAYFKASPFYEVEEGECTELKGGGRRFILTWLFTGEDPLFRMGRLVVVHEGLGLWMTERLWDADWYRR